ncbi:multidrug effflux MFS transporter [Gordonia desulfuricans]|uniref:Multidrug effflux MFS transporter n=1 Tax=Gordonia desulfuricans TaxID=89051 RepID=A0A7K3LIC5_9ACTN|nr:multidrug effflux MFS transporter [Gordonia desulfuricans]NDK88012.1 multidrug effflux MFS transporter [Gordonia desulfuricans]
MCTSTSSTDSTRETAGPPSTARGGVTGPILLVLALLSAVAPFATDLYLAAFPEMTEELHASETAVQLSLTAFLIGVTVGQLTFGPLSDRFGRRTPLLVGSVLCVAAGVVTVMAPTVGVLVAARFVQGLGGAAGMVIGRAIIADLAVGKQAARAFSLMMIVGGVAPVVAPLIGGFLVGPFGWRGILSVVLALSVAMLVSIVTVIRESLPPEKRSRRKGDTSSAEQAPSILRNRQFVSYSVAFAFAFAVLMGYISASPFLYQDMIGLSSSQYGLTFGANSLCLVCVSALSARLVATHAVRDLMRIGLLVMSSATIVFAILVATSAPSWSLAIPLVAVVGSLGLVLGNGTALALSSAGARAGRASAVIGALQFGIAAVVSPLVSIKGSATAAPLAIVMIVAAAVSLCAFTIAGRSQTEITEQPV